MRIFFGLLIIGGMFALFIREILVAEKESNGITEYNEKFLKADAKILRIERIKTFKKEIRTQVMFSDGFLFTTTKTKSFLCTYYVDNEMRREIAKMAIEAHDKALKKHGIIKE